ncbi:MAG TPA: CDP-diacylglycerol--glycerol-3-phosphate 3-phosphatidyltransferase [Xanthobacteraceae bacterium]|nr:CDP-diacylglycerol--glycerol-3-phosphate 3-phosphatidyltransferase [Xanthobacteraceae bacterium]
MRATTRFETASADEDRAFAVPNLLTYARVASVPLIAACLFGVYVFNFGMWLRWMALAIFILAAVTDMLDGWYARRFGQWTTIGRMLDPIADKLLVGGCLFMLAADDTIKGWTLWAGLIILCREILVSGMREYLAGLRVSVPVSRLGKWKTFMQLLAIGFLLAGEAGDQVIPQTTEMGIILLWISALLTLYTGFDYFRAGAKHLVRNGS